MPDEGSRDGAEDASGSPRLSPSTFHHGVEDRVGHDDEDAVEGGQEADRSFMTPKGVPLPELRNESWDKLESSA